MITINTLTLPHSSDRLARDLVLQFGGYTRVDGQGEWYDKVKGRTIWEWVSVYTVAFDAIPFNQNLFRATAVTEGLNQGQDEVFITLGGEGEFIDLRDKKATANDASLERLASVA